MPLKDSQTTRTEFRIFTLTFRHPITYASSTVTSFVDTFFPIY
jgi:hypothetical protein